MGLKLKEDFEIKCFIQKNDCFPTFFLPKFSLASVFTALVNNFMLTDQQFEVPGMEISFKMSHLEG